MKRDDRIVEESRARGQADRHPWGTARRVANEADLLARKLGGARHTPGARRFIERAQMIAAEAHALADHLAMLYPHIGAGRRAQNAQCCHGIAYDAPCVACTVGPVVPQ